MRRTAAAIALFVACACSTSSPAATTSPATATVARAASAPAYPAASPAPGNGRYAVFQRGRDHLDLVAVPRGNVAAGVDFEPALFRPNALMPWASASLARLYYLNAGSQVGWVGPDGRQGFATTIAISATEQAGFAVSPDDNRIAVSIFTYSSSAPDASYIGMRLYVEDLVAGGHHVDIFTSSTIAEFPIGWVGGNLVVAVSAPFCCKVPLVNPYGADSYHVVDPATGRRLRSICSAAAPPQGPVEPVGVMCGLDTFIHWDGTPFPRPAVVPDPGVNRVALSPDGTAVLYGGSPVWVIRGTNEFALDESGVASGWVDAINVVVMTPDSAYWLLDARTGLGAEMAGETSYLGAFPAAIS